MTKLPSMPFYPADFFADTQDVSGAAARVYLFLLGHAWIRDGALPNDDCKLARMARLNMASWARVKDEVLPFFEAGGDGMLRNKRMIKDRVRVLELSTTNSDNAKKRWGQKTLKFNGHSNATALGPHSDRYPYQNQSQIYKEESFLNGKTEKRSRLEAWLREQGLDETQIQAKCALITHLDEQ